MTNTFMTSAKKAMSEQHKIESNTRHQEQNLKAINILIPSELHEAAQLHRIYTGENTTQLIRRLLKNELT